MNVKKKFRILVIDDNKDIFQDFTKILSLNNKSDDEMDLLEQDLFGDKNNTSPKEPTFNTPDFSFQIDYASQGQQGLECVKQAINENFPFSLAFVDMRMPPGWDGIETIKHIWQVDQNIQTVICTAYSDYSWEQTVEELGLRDNLLILKNHLMLFHFASWPVL